MPAVELDARLLAGGPAAVRAALAERLGEPTLVVLDESPPDPTAVMSLRQLPVIVAARAPVPAELRSGVDLVLEDAEELARVESGFERAPVAAVAAALLLRAGGDDWWSGLVRESAVYSMLQSGAEFRRWREGRGAAPQSVDDDPRVRVTSRDGVTEVVLTRPNRHNALDRRMRDELYTALEETAGPVLLLGDGPSFCSGGDLEEFGTFPDPAVAHLVRLTRSLAALLAAARDRVVVGVHGRCLGAGIELPAFARHVIASDDAVLGLPELGLGLIPGAGGTVSLPARVGRHRCLSLLLTAGTIPAPVALEWGLVDEVVARDELRGRGLEIATAL